MEQIDPTSEPLTKVAIQLDQSTYEVETLWAEPVGGDLYRLRNVPFLAYGYSEQDLVRADEVDGRLVVRGVAKRGGHSTYRIFLPALTDDEAFRPLWEPLEALLVALMSGLISD